MEGIDPKNSELPLFLLKLIARGEADGEVRGKRQALLLLAQRLGWTLSEQQRARIIACDDAATLDRWLGRVVGAPCVDYLFVPKALETLLQGIDPREVKLPPFVQKIVDRSEARGEAHGKRQALLLVAGRLGLALSEEQRARIAACEDVETLERWLDHVVGAKSADDLFA